MIEPVPFFKWRLGYKLQDINPQQQLILLLTDSRFEAFELTDHRRLSNFTRAILLVDTNSVLR